MSHPSHPSRPAVLDRIPAHESDFAQAVAGFCLRDFQPPPAGLRATFPKSGAWQAVRSTGTALWLDTGDIDAIAELWTQEFSALTTNNTLLNKEVQKGMYDDLVTEAAGMLRERMPEIGDDLLVLEIAFVLNAVHGLKLVSRFDADVSVELHTHLARDAEASYRYGKRFHAICGDRFIVKVPLTPEGLLAARRLSDDGIRVNFTLGFSARQNHLIASFARPRWVNVFMGRNGAFVKDNQLGDGENIGEKATLASQRMLRELRAAGGPVVEQIGASIRSGEQCLDLLGVDVFTIPTAAAKEYLALAPAANRIIDKTGHDPEVRLSAEAEHVAKMWEVSEQFRAAVDALDYSPDLTGDAIREHLATHGASDLFPAMDDLDRERLTRESKIPRAASWRDRVAMQNASWDGLLSEAALCSFHADQMLLDERIRGAI